MSDPISLEGLIAWLETKPANEEYTYLNTLQQKCLIWQYLEHHHYAVAGVGSGYYRVHPETYTMIDFPYGWEDTAVAIKGELTFGHALKRAKELKEKENA